MIQIKNFDELMADMLARVDDRYDKREGSLIYTALAPAAAELTNAYIALDWMAQESNPETATRDGLLLLAANRGLFPFEATKAVYEANFNVSVPLGSRFNAGDLNFVVIEQLPDNKALLQCETVGSIGNGMNGDIHPIDYIAGLTVAQLVALVVPGEDEEDTERFRQRYFDSLRAQAFGGNVAQYKDEVNRIDGVGGVKVYPHWDGAGTVKLVIIAGDYKQSTSAVIAPTVQTTIDPDPGLGYGIAPIGHQVTVEPIQTRTVNITMSVTPEDGFVWVDIKPEIEVVIDAYFLELAQGWQDQSAVVVRVSQIESRLLDVIGILDVENTKLNGSGANLLLSDVEIPIRGTVAQS